MKKIVTDTNIWYVLASDHVLFEKVKDLPLAPNHINIYELSTSFNLLKYPEETRSAIQKGNNIQVGPKITTFAM